MSLSKRRRESVALAAAACLVHWCGAAAQEMQTKKADWATLTSPKGVLPGETFEVKVSYRGLPEGTHLHCDLKTEAHSMLQWQKPVVVKGEGSHVFKCRAKRAEGVKKIYALVFCTKDGNWKTHFNVTATGQIAFLGEDGKPLEPKAQPYKGKSWLSFDPGVPNDLQEGQEFDVTVHYNLDGDEAVEGSYAFILLGGLGPWKDSRGRGHQGYFGMNRTEKVGVGRGKITVRYKAPKCWGRDALQIIAFFCTDPANAWGTSWPGEVRTRGIKLRATGGFFRLETDEPGNLFRYQDPVVVLARLRNVRQEDVGAAKTLAYRVADFTGAEIARGEKRFTVEKDGQAVPMALQIDRRGTFHIEVDVPGWEKRTCAFCRIPDVLAVTKGRRTPFGGTNFVTPGPTWFVEESCQVAQRIGMTICRTFTRWYHHEPLPGVYDLDPWEEPLALAKKYGIDAYIEIQSPPVWNRQKEWVTSWAAPPKWDAWRKLIEEFTTRFKGKIYAFEWLNEICPGGWWMGTPEQYATLCKIGTETAKSIDPSIMTTFAGGIFPRTFANEIMAAGGGRFVDVIPTHYGDGAKVREATGDAGRHGLEPAIWNNESATCVTWWKEPLLDDVTHRGQSQYLLKNWTDMLADGCERIMWFSWADACANWAPNYEDLTPRPVEATLAVYTVKLFGAEPVGVFGLGAESVFYLFDRGGEAVVIARSGAKEEAKLVVGSDEVVLTDYQGNETALAAPGGVATLGLGEMPIYIEGGNLEVLKAYVVPTLGLARLVGGIRAGGSVSTRPRMSALAGTSVAVPVRLANLYDWDVEGRFRIKVPQGWVEPDPVEFSLKKGETKIVPVTVVVPEDAEPCDVVLSARFTFR